MVTAKRTVPVGEMLFVFQGWLIYLTRWEIYISHFTLMVIVYQWLDVTWFCLNQQGRGDSGVPLYNLPRSTRWVFNVFHRPEHISSLVLFSQLIRESKVSISIVKKVRHRWFCTSLSSQSDCMWKVKSQLLTRHCTSQIHHHRTHSV